MPAIKKNQSVNEALFRMVLLIRRAEETLETLFAANEVPGFIHLSIGQEAIAAGVMSILSEDDTVASTHRGHGHALAKGVPLNAFFAEIMGRDEGACRGRGGSMHIADLTRGMLGANGIVGAGPPLAVGSAISHQMSGKGNIAVAFFGDGSVAEGALHECLNLAALWKLPILFVCEDNGWSEFSESSAVLAVDLKKLAAAFGIPYKQADGLDAVSVVETASAIVEDVRAGKGPAFLHFRTHRHRGHFAGDPQRYRGEDAIATAEKNDPVDVMKEKLKKDGLTPGAISLIDQDVSAEIAAALKFARASARPDPAAAIDDVYAAPAREAQHV